jgi:citrate lyase synthetase
MEYNGKPISASEVRRLVDENKFDELKEIVPELTLQYLYNRTRKKQHTEII